jgi:thiamine monophosphate synthase
MLWMITDFQKTPDPAEAVLSICNALGSGADKVSLRNKGFFNFKEILMVLEQVVFKYPKKEVFLHDVDPQSVPWHNCFHFSSKKIKEAVSLKRNKYGTKVALSTHSEKEYTEAFSQGIDYAFLSPVFKPLSKPDDERKNVQPVCLKNLYLLGGIDRMRCRLLIEKGFTNIAGISLFYGSSAEQVILEMANLIKEKENESINTN